MLLNSLQCTGMPPTPPQHTYNNHLAQRVNSAEGEKPCPTWAVNSNHHESGT